MSQDNLNDDQPLNSFVSPGCVITRPVRSNNRAKFNKKSLEKRQIKDEKPSSSNNILHKSNIQPKSETKSELNLQKMNTSGYRKIGGKTVCILGNTMVMRVMLFREFDVY